MNFKDLKPGYPLYILDRNNMTSRTAKVTDVSVPHIDAKIGGVNNLVVDVTTEEGTAYVMIADTEAAYPDGKVISTDIQNILREINAMKSTAEQALRQVEHQRQTVEKCNHLLADLDPAQKEKQQTEQRFQNLETKINSMLEMMKKLTD